MGIFLTNVEVRQEMHSQVECRGELIVTGMNDMATMQKLTTMRVDLGPTLAALVEHFFVPGDYLECISDDNQYTVKKGNRYHFKCFNKSGKVELKECGGAYAPNRFKKVEKPRQKTERENAEAGPTIIQYGTPLVGKTAIPGHVSGSIDLKIPQSNAFLSELASRMGISVDPGRKMVVEDKTTDHLYIHPNNNKSVGLPVRRVRQGRKLIP